MSKKHKTLFGVLITCIILVAYYYFSLHYTFYGMGIVLIPIVLPFSWVATFLVHRYTRKWKDAFWLLFCSITSLLFTGLLIIFAVDNYKPSFCIHVPEDFEGMVHLLPAKASSHALFIDQHGIGYFNPGVEANISVQQGNRDITHALNQYGRKSLMFTLPDSLHYRAIEIRCFEVIQDRVYSESIWNQPHATCMNEQTFIRMLASGKIDSTLLVQHTYSIHPEY